MTATSTSSSRCSTRWCASRCCSPCRSAGGPGIRCWRQSASSPRSNSSRAEMLPRCVPRIARYFAGRETDITALWDSPRQREAYDWFAVELANLRTAFRWAADHRDLDDAADHRHLRGVTRPLRRKLRAHRLGGRIDRARPRCRPSTARLPVLHGDAVLDRRTHRGGRPVQRRRTGGDAHRRASRSPSDSRATWRVRIWPLVSPIGQSSGAVPCSRDRPDAHGNVTALLVVLLTIAGRDDDAIAATDGLVDIAEATRNPYTLSMALMAYGFAWRNADPNRALEAMHRGLAIAHDSGNRFNESHLTANLAHAEVERRRSVGGARSHQSRDSPYARFGQHRHSSVRPWQPRRSSSTGSGTTNRRPPSPVSQFSPD